LPDQKHSDSFHREVRFDQKREEAMKFHVVLAALAVVVAPMIVQAMEPTAERRVDDSNKVTCRVTRPVGSRLGGVRT
jgi:hypothetical protein